MEKAKTLPYREGNSIVIFDASLVGSIAPLRRKHSPLFFFGFLLLLISFASFFSLAAPIIINEFSYRYSQPKVAKHTFGELLAKNEEFYITIPKIKLETKVIANVDSQNESEYQAALKIGVAHAKGTSFPGQGRLIYLFSHSTDYIFNIKNYNALFYNLDKLTKGDRITLVYLGRNYFYEVTEKKTVVPSDTAVLKIDNSEKLILQTCWPPGTTWQRLLVIADPIKPEASSL